MSVAAEVSVLGTILLNNDAYKEASHLGLKSANFSLDSHQRIFSRMSDLADNSLPIDLVTLAEQLDRHRELEKVGGRAYLSRLLDGVPDRPSIAQYVEIVLNASVRRFATQQIRNAERSLNDPTVPVRAVAEVGGVLTRLSEGCEG